jgi:hypothetical protein
MKRTLIALGFTVLTGAAQICAAQDIDCTLAPSQNAIVNRVSGAAGGATATAYALAQATGLSVVAHSSGAYILTGSAGYVAGTLGTAVAGPIIVGVGLVIGGAAVTVELLCAPKNHPAEVAKVKEASSEFMRRSKEALSSTPKAIQEAQDKASQMASNATIKAKQVSGDIYKYAYESLPVPK